MRWPWDRDNMQPKRDNLEEVTVPANAEVRRSQERLERINRILAESQRVEMLIRKQRG